MGLLRTLLTGRPNGMRARILQKLGLHVAPPQPSSETVPPPVASHRPAEKSLELKKEPPRDVTPPEGYEVVLHKDALEAGRIIEVIIGGTAIAVAHTSSGWFATSNACPHAEGPLGEGSLEGCVVTCPYHGWQFDMSTGACKTNPYAKVQTYPVQVVGDAVCVRL